MVPNTLHEGLAFMKNSDNPDEVPSVSREKSIMNNRQSKLIASFPKEISFIIINELKNNQTHRGVQYISIRP